MPTSPKLACALSGAAGAVAGGLLVALGSPDAPAAAGTEPRARIASPEAPASATPGIDVAALERRLADLEASLAAALARAEEVRRLPAQPPDAPPDALPEALLERPDGEAQASAAPAPASPSPADADGFLLDLRRMEAARDALGLGQGAPGSLEERTRKLAEFLELDALQREHARDVLRRSSDRRTEVLRLWAAGTPSSQLQPLRDEDLRTLRAELRELLRPDQVGRLEAL